jgi:poly(ADP-ribose) glycohydrolase ARH3
MRIAPVGIFYYDDADKLREIAYKSSHITHSHVLGKEGAALQAFSTALAVRGTEKEAMMLELKDFVKTEVYKEKLSKVESREAAFNSVPTAVYSFLRADSFKDAVVYAVSLGGDTDTIAAMTGAISGAYYGEGGIPEEWEKKLEEGKKGRQYIRWLGEELYRVKFCNV